MSEKTGIDQLRSLPRYVYSTIETANGRVIDKRFAVTVTEDEAIAIADQIEREHAEELAAAKRDLADEAREAVERLRMVSHDDILRSANPEHEIVDELCKAVGVERDRTYTGILDTISNRIAELIERGGKPDADLCDVCERTVSLEWVNERGGLDVVQERINSFARMLNSVDSIVCGDEQHCFGERVDLGEADELFGAIYGELDKRLMPPGMAWPRWDDGKQVSHYDTLEDATAICLALDGSCYSLHYDMPDGERVCLFDGSERVKRPEPEVLGADGLPIRDGETVHLDDEHAGMAGNAGEGFSLLGIDPGCDVTVNWIVDGKARLVEYGASCPASWLAHTPPDYQQRIDDDATLDPATYCDEVLGWDAEKIVHRSDYAAQNEAMIADLLRRQRELDAKTRGGEL